MAEQFRILGQSAPAAATDTDLYTVVDDVAGAVISTLAVCNTTTGQRRIRISTRPAGATLALEHYLYYDAFIGANSSVAITIGITLGPLDVVTVYADDAGVVFHAYGTEVLA